MKPGGKSSGCSRGGIIEGMGMEQVIQQKGLTNSEYFQMTWAVLILNEVNNLTKCGPKPPD